MFAVVPDGHCVRQILLFKKCVEKHLEHSFWLVSLYCWQPSIDARPVQISFLKITKKKKMVLKIKLETYLPELLSNWENPKSMVPEHNPLDMHSS